MGVLTWNECNDMQGYTRTAAYHLFLVEESTGCYAVSTFTLFFPEAMTACTAICFPQLIDNLLQQEFYSSLFIHQQNVYETVTLATITSDIYNPSNVRQTLPARLLVFRFIDCVSSQIFIILLQVSSCTFRQFFFLLQRIPVLSILLQDKAQSWSSVLF